MECFKDKSSRWLSYSKFLQELYLSLNAQWEGMANNALEKGGCSEARPIDHSVQTCVDISLNFGQYL